MLNWRNWTKSDMDEDSDYVNFINSVETNSESVSQYYTKSEMAQIIAVLMYMHEIKFEDLNEIYNQGC